MKKIFLSSLVAAGLLISGCATFSLETNEKMTQSIFLNPVPKEKKIIYLVIKNTSDMPGVDEKIKSILIKKLTEKGYKIVDNPKAAHYVLFVNVLFANNIKEKNAGAAAGFGTAVGAASGAGAGGGRNALAGAVIGGIVYGVGAKLTEDETIRIVTDVRIKEKINDNATNLDDDKSYKTYETRIFTQATKTHLKVKDALPVLEEKMANSIANIF
jgi:hypothetical protein